VCRLPESWASALFNVGADIAWRRQGGGVQVLEGNLIRVLRTDTPRSSPGEFGGVVSPGEFDPVDGKELRKLSRAVLRSYARYYMEAFRLPVIPLERVREGMHIGQANVDVALTHMKNGRGVIFARRLRAGKLVCLVADRDLSDTGIEVDFFGEKALLPAGPAALAVQTGAALMPVSCWFAGESEWGAEVHDEIPVPATGTRKEKVAAMTQAMASVFEQAIREHPEDWHMLQKVFVNDLDPERLARSRARAAEDGGRPAEGGEPEAPPRGNGGRAAPHAGGSRGVVPPDGEQ
jgi:KDO2-lipid IV(A) lauroyltransferase